MNLVPKNGNGKVDWLAFVRTTWPIILAVIMLSWYLGGRLESPDEKQSRIVAHEQISGHPVMVERVRAIDDKLERIEEKLDRLLESRGVAP